MYEDNCTYIPLPDLFTHYAGLTDSQYALLVIGAILVTAVLALGTVHLMYVWKYVSDERIRSKLYILALLFPMIVALSIISMVSPRSSPLLTSVGLLYIQYSMYTAISLNRIILGGYERFSSMLNDEKVMMNFQVPPCCCCMPCLPKPAPSAQKLNIMECLSLQGTIVRVIIVIINCHLVSEFPEQTQHLLLVTELAGILSLLFTLFGSHAIGKITGPYVQQYRSIILFRFTDISLALFTAQLPLIFDLIFVKYGVITSGPVQTALGNAKYLNSFVLICEAFLLSILASLLMTPKKSALFDKYPQRLDLSSPREKILPKQ
ncbi:unnamed protein product [Cylicocyclus nassatus]|uniref:Organic solute transporter alpha-like protein n=1 Tax=Cylicocyclus nassatus TaxID=53992 RepID=A0AA36MG80_CYLNA|nr:unnamed protein product [Cylicocyclus nassatus]